jgi:hypothetical protein
MEKKMLIGLSLFVIVITFNTIAFAQESLRLILIPQKDTAPINLENFPIVEAEFALLMGKKYQTEIEEGDIRIFEDGIEITSPITNPITLNEIQKPLSHSIVFDFGDERTAIDKNLFDKFIANLSGVSTNSSEGIDIELDTWKFCATNFAQICHASLQGSLSTSDLHSSLDLVYKDLSQPPIQVPTVTVSTILQHILLVEESSPNKRIVIILKMANKDPEMPYISETMFDEYFQRKIPILLINLDEDSETFTNNINIRINRLDGSIFTRYGDKRWDRDNGLTKELRVIRPTHYLLSYESRLFHDNESHRISLVYHQDREDEIWVHDDFGFFPINQGVKSELKWLPRRAVSNVVLMLSTLMLLLILILVTSDLKVDE